MNFQNIKARLHDGRILHLPSWQLEANQHWAIIGTSGSGKTAVSQLFANKLLLSQGTAEQLPKQVTYVSLEAQAEQIELEKKQDQSDILNQKDPGTLVKNFLAPIENLQNWPERLGITHLYEQGFRSLSTGESRKAMLLRALNQQPDLLVLDSPLAGLDDQSRQVARELIEHLHQQGQAILWVANRLDELPEWITHALFVHDAQVLAQGPKQELLALPEVHALLHFDKPLSEFPPANKALQLPAQQPLVQLHNVRIQYGERVLFEGLNWQVNPGEHWAIQGPNGSGKTSLLQLITGDNPQCYTNNLRLFGIQRGSGESIWDIKKYIGIVSSSLQWEYKASTNVLSTVISGLYDSIGLYRATGDDDKQLALKWLEIIGLRHKANQSLQHLSYGELRLVLIVRALIKQPSLLILDEPCQGLDDPSRLMVLAFINKLAEQKNITLLYVTHHGEEIPSSITKRLIFKQQISGTSVLEVAKQDCQE